MDIREWGRRVLGGARERCATRRIARKGDATAGGTNAYFEALESRILLTTFTDVDVGTTGAAGSAVLNAGTWTVKGSGSDIWSTQDTFNYNYTTVTGDNTIIARVGGLTGTGTLSPNAKAGIMFRDTTVGNVATATSASYVMVDVTPVNGIEFNERNGAGTAVTPNNSQLGVGAPYWLKLVKTGTTFIAYTAPDVSGSAGTWTPLDSPINVPFTNSTFLAGILVCSHNSGVLDTGTFSNVVVNAAPTVQTAASATPATVVGTSTALSVLGADDAGEAGLTYTWATTGTPPEPVTFSFGGGISNGTNGAKNATANFVQTGLYHFQVTITDGVGATVTSSVNVNVTVPGALPSKPTGVFAQFQGSSVVATWNATPGAATYDIYRGSTSGGEGATPIATGISTLTFADTTAASGQTYYYQVSGVNANGEGLRSAEVQSVTGVDMLSFHGNTVDSVGVNAQEILLTPGDVSAATFGKGWSTSILDTPTLDGIPGNVLNGGINYTAPTGQAYGEPLVKTGVTITTGAFAGTVHDVVYVTTQVGSVYAIDANNGTLLWKDSFIYNASGNPNPLNAAIPDGTTAIPGGFGTETNSQDVSPWLCIMGTPVIDPASGYMYLIANTRFVAGGAGGNQANPHYLYTIHKISLTNGQDTASVFADTTYLGASSFTFNSGPYSVGTGAGAITVGGQSRVYFNAVRQMIRPALELVNGRIYAASASHGDVDPYHGWVLSFDAGSLTLNGALDTTPNGSEGGIWASGDGLVFDAQGNFYAVTGNGTFDGNYSTTNGVTTYTGLDANGNPINGDYGNAFIKMQLDPTSTQANVNANGWGIKIVDYYTPSNTQTLNLGDKDLGSGGAILLPPSAGSAAHPNLIVETGKEGTIYLLDTSSLGKFKANDSGVVQILYTVMNGSYGTPAYFNGRLYYSPTGSQIFSWQLTNGFIDLTTKQSSPDTISYTGTSPYITANGTQNGVMWALGGGELRAYDAGNLASELWVSTINAGRDALSTVKFSVATPVNGRVYAVTNDGKLVAYELAPQAPVNGFETLYSGSQINLQWTNVAPNATSFQVYRSTTGVAGTYTLLPGGTLGPGVMSYQDTGLTAGVDYAYQVKAVDVIGASIGLTIHSPFTGITNGSGGSYTITGISAGNYILHATAGTVSISADLSAQGTVGLDVATGVMVNVSSVEHLGGVTIANGALVTLGSGATLVAQTLTFTGTGTGKLNIGSGFVDITGSDTPTARGWIKNGQLYSSVALDGQHPYRGLGLLAGSDFMALRGNVAFAGQTVHAGDQLIRYTWMGDANLDGVITEDDYAQLDEGYLFGRSGWVYGDSDYSGAVSAADYAAIAGAKAQPGPLGEMTLTSEPVVSEPVVPLPVMSEAVVAPPTEVAVVDSTAAIVVNAVAEGDVQEPLAVDATAPALEAAAPEVASAVASVLTIEPTVMPIANVEAAPELSLPLAEAAEVAPPVAGEPKMSGWTIPQADGDVGGTGESDNDGRHSKHMDGARVHLPPGVSILQDHVDTRRSPVV